MKLKSHYDEVCKATYLQVIGPRGEKALVITIKDDGVIRLTTSRIDFALVLDQFAEHVQGMTPDIIADYEIAEVTLRPKLKPRPQV